MRRDFHDIVPKPEFGGCLREFAFGHDEVAPLSQQPLDPRNGWGATIVDAMNTMVCVSRFILYVYELNNLSTSWDSQYDNSRFLPPCLIGVINLGPFQRSTQLRKKYQLRGIKHYRHRQVRTLHLKCIQNVSHVDGVAASLRAPSVTLED